MIGMDRHEIPNTGAFTLAFTNEGLEIVSYPSGGEDRTVISDLFAIGRIAQLAREWWEENRCQVSIQEAGYHVVCELRRGHPGLHEGRRFDSSYATTLAVVAWESRPVRYECGRPVATDEHGRMVYCALESGHGGKCTPVPLNE